SSTVLKERDAEVVRDKPRQALIAVHLLKYLDCVARLARRHIDIRPQELDVISDLRRHHTVDPPQRVLRIVELILLEVDSREPERGLVAHGFIDGAFEHRLDGTTGAVVHAVVELEIADGEFGVVDVIVQRIESGLVETVVHSELSVEPLDCIEEPSLQGLIERLAEIEIPQVAAHRWTDGKYQGKTESDQPASHSHRSPFPKRDGSVAGTGHRQSHHLWLHFLAEGKAFRAAEVRTTLELPVDNHLELVIPRRHIAEVDPLHATFSQR